jgi:hypothetical protein
VPGPFIRTNDYPRITFDVLSPVFAPPDGALAGFNGDYSGLTIPKGVDAHPIWSDNAEWRSVHACERRRARRDIFTDSKNLPDGKAKVGPGKIGKN